MKIKLLFQFIILNIFILNLFGQPAEIPYYFEAYRLESGKYDGSITSGNSKLPVLTEIVEFSGVPWMGLHFGNSNLGKESYIVITSLLDGNWQKINSQTLDEWNYNSAFFNGDAVKIELFVAMKDKGIYFQLTKIIVGEWKQGGVSIETICGTEDNRLSSNDPAVGRIVPVGGTGWIVENGLNVTAGHCFTATIPAEILEFNVPPSLPDGTIQHPSPDNQYAIDQTSIVFNDGGVGNDWGVFEVFDNPNTSLQPIDAQNASFNVVRDITPTIFRITGFGVDGPAPDFGNPPPRNEDNQTQQSHTGPNDGSSGTTLRYQVDTQGGNSGSPVINEITGDAVGVHTAGGCTSTGGHNSGTSTFNTDFWDALNEAFEADYSISNLNFSPPNPVVGETVSVSATLTNEGTATQPSAVQVVFYVDDIQKNSTTTVPSLAPDQTTPVNFNWIAEEGAHNIKVQSFLQNDQNPGNDFEILPINVGTEGELIVNGSNAPTNNITLNPNTNSSLNAILENIGSAAINGSVTKSGSQSSWVALSGGTSFSVPAGNSTTYPYQVSVPSGTSPGNYNASIQFSYDGGSSYVNLILAINVVEFDEGEFEQVLLSGSTLIDGSWLTTTMRTFAVGSQFYLDNYPATTHNYKQEFTHNLTDDEYKKLNGSNWNIRAYEQEGSAGLRLSIQPEGNYKKYTSDVNPSQTIDIIEWWTPGNNTVKIGLDGIITTGEDTKWWVYDTDLFLRFSQAAWATNFSISQSNLDLWDTGWDRGRIYFDVDNVSASGALHLFINGELVDSESITGSGSNKYLTFRHSDLSTSNYINIKGDIDDDTRANISNIRFYVKYFTGDPNLVCTKSLSTSTANLNQNVTVNLSFQNVGSNIAYDPLYNDSPLPTGISLVSGNISGDPGDVDPGDTGTASYTIKGAEVGNYTFGATNVTYENGSNNFVSTFNAVTLNVNGGDLNITASLNAGEISLNDPINISASVVGSILNNNVTDAIVECTITKPTSTTQVFNLLYNPTSQQYEGTFTQTGLYGVYGVDISATRNYYNSGILSPSLDFTVSDPPTISNVNALATDPYSAILSGYVNPNASSTNIYFEYGETQSYGNSTPFQNIGSSTSFVSVSDVITGLTPNTTYHVRLYATNSRGDIYSEDVSFTTPDIFAYPEPTNLTASGGNSVVDLNWDAPTFKNYLGNSSKSKTSKSSNNKFIENEINNNNSNVNISNGNFSIEASIDHYIIYRSLDQGGPYSNIGTSETTDYQDVNVNNGTTYYYVVTAVYNDPTGESSYSNEAIAIPMDNLLPPSNLTATPGNNLIELNWDLPVFKFESDDAFNGSEPKTGKVKSLNKALNNIKTFGKFNPSSNLKDNNSPSGNNYREVTKGDEIIRIPITTSPIEQIITQYNIYRSTSSGGTYTLIGNSQTNSYVDNTANNGAPYYYVVTAVYGDPAGESDYSNETGTTPAIPTDILVWEREENGVDFSGYFIKLELENLGYTVVYSTVFPFSLVNYKAVFLSFGNYGSGSYIAVTPKEATAIQNYLENAGKVYLEGGDALVFDINGLLGNTEILGLFGLSDGDDGNAKTIQNLVGQPNVITNDMNFNKSFQVNNSFIDTYTPLPEAYVAFEEIGYGNVAVQYYGAFNQRTFCFSYSLADLMENIRPSWRNTLIKRIAEFLIDGTYTPELYATPQVIGATTNAGSQQINVYNFGSAVMNWTAVSSDPSWLSITSGASGTNDGTINVSYSENTGSYRFGAITITAPSAEGSPINIEVRQSGVNDDWTQVTSAGGSSISLIDENAFWTVGGTSANKTTSGGSAWDRSLDFPPMTTSPRRYYYSLDDIQFIDNDNGWVGGVGSYLSAGVGPIANDAPVLFRTSDAGDTWSIYAFPINITDDYILEDFHFINSTTGWIINSEGGVSQTTDGGSSWSQIAFLSGAKPYSSIFFSDALHGWVSGDLFCHRTTDGGNSWSSVEPAGLETTWTSVFFLDNLNGFAVSSWSGNIVKSTDGGVNWDLLYTNPSEQLNDIYFIDNDNGYVVGSNGLVLSTSDGGDTWNEQECGTTNNLTNIQFTSLGAGYISGANGTLLKLETQDQVSLAYPANSSLYMDADFTLYWHEDNSASSYNLQVASDVGFNNIIIDEPTVSDTFYQLSSLNNLSDYYWRVKGNYPTEEAIWSDIWQFQTGEEYGWAKKTSGLASGFNQVQNFADACWIGSGTILRSLNNGSYWDVKRKSAGGSSYFLNSNMGWVSGLFNEYMDPIIIKTTDGGDTWNEQYIAIGTFHFYGDLHFFNETSGVVIDDEGRIYYTTNGGNNWNYSSRVGVEPFYDDYTRDVFYLNGTSWWAAIGGGGIYKTTDGGGTWNSLSVSGLFNNIYFIDVNNGWAVGTGGSIKVTSDGGTNWQTQTSGTPNDLREVYFVDNLNGWAAGDAGTIIKTTDGGQTWTSENTITTENIYDLYFDDLNHGWAVGANGTILKYDSQVVSNPPQISVTPSNISFSVPIDGSDSEILNIANVASSGADDLIWDITEQEIVLVSNAGKKIQIKIHEKVDLLEMNSNGTNSNQQSHGNQVAGIEADCLWLSESQTAGTITAGSNQDITVSVDATGLSAGTYSCNLNINSTDPNNSIVPIPIALNVEECTNNILGNITCPQNAAQGSSVNIPLQIDMTDALAPDNLLGSFTGTLSYDPLLLDYTGNSGILSGFLGSINIDETNGDITFNGINPAGLGNLIDILSIDFDVIGSVGSTVNLVLEYSAMATAITFSDLTPCLIINNGSFDIIPPGFLGDVNNDDLCNSTDALIILSNDVGLTIPPDILIRIGQGYGDVNSDALTNSTDALIILSSDVGISVPFPVCDPFSPVAKNNIISQNKVKGKINVTTLPNGNLSKGNSFKLPIFIDMSDIKEKLGSYTATIEWDPTLFEYEASSGGTTLGFDDPLINNTEVEKGKLIFTQANPLGADKLINVLNLQFKVLGEIHSSSSLTLEFSSITSSKTFVNLLPNLNYDTTKKLELSVLPPTYGLENYPNPFNPTTVIKYTLPEAQVVKLAVYNILGQQVRMLVNQEQSEGIYTIEWNSKNDHGQMLSSGVYILRMQAGNQVFDRKLLLLK